VSALGPSRRDLSHIKPSTPQAGRKDRTRPGNRAEPPTSLQARGGQATAILRCLFAICHSPAIDLPNNPTHATEFRRTRLELLFAQGGGRARALQRAGH
jgi:hypothetical protein